MSGNIETLIEQEWDEIALDDETFIDQLPSYTAIIHPRDDANAPTIESKIEDISHSPEVNSAPTATVGVEPRDELQTTDYLSGVLDIYVKDEPLFSGKIVKIDANKRQDNFFSIKAISPGQKLKEKSINENTDNYIITDYIAKKVDKYNSWDDEHFNLIDTSQESLNSVSTENRTRVFNSDSSTATYTDVGTDASSVENLYVKLRGTGDATVSIEDSNSNTYSETFTDVNSVTRGEWRKIQPTGLDSASYDIIFDFDADYRLYDWISVTDSEVERDVTPQPVGTGFEGRNLLTVSNFSQDYIQEQIDDTDPVEADSNGIRALQSCFLTEAEDVGNSNYSDVSYSGGEGALYDGPSGFISFDFFLPYQVPIDDAVVLFRGQNDSTIRGDLEFDGNLILGDYSPISSGLDWYEEALDIRQDDLGDYINPGTHSISFDINAGSVDSGETGLRFDLVGFYDDRWHSLDNTVHEDNGYLDRPHNFPNFSFGNEVQFTEVSTGQNISSTTVSVNSNDPDGINSIGVSFDSGNSFTSGNNTNEYTRTTESIVSSIVSEVQVASYSPSGAQDATPRFGYAGEEVTQVDVTVDTEDLQLLFNTDESGNTLDVISSLADQSATNFRWEGNTCKIFLSGTEKTSPALKEETVTSTVDIENVYSECKVIGDGVETDFIQADNAPDFVDKQKILNKPDISNESDAERAAISFLQNNSAIEYKGDIQTLPTLAPVGSEIDGSIFSHGQDSIIERVRYGKRSASITCGLTKDLEKEILGLDRDVDSLS